MKKDTRNEMYFEIFRTIYCICFRVIYHRRMESTPTNWQGQKMKVAHHKLLRRRVFKMIQSNVYHAFEKRKQKT